MRLLRWTALLAIVGGLGFCIYSAVSDSFAFYALAARKLEMTITVADASTGKPIPNAMITLHGEEWKDGKRENNVRKLTCDEHGMALLVQEDNSCEDIIRPLKKTKTLIDLTWAVIDVSANGYQREKDIWLHTAPYDNKGTFKEGENYIQRLELALLLHPLSKN